MEKLKMRCELLEVEGSFNVRDLGGYLNAEGKPVQYRRFIRAASLSDLTENGKQALRNAGVDCVIDLRSSHEVTTKPDAIEQDPAFNWQHIPMLDFINSNIAESKLDAFPESMEVMYKGMLDNAQGSFLRMFEIFASPDYNCYLFHCTAGKDRTGVTAMLLLALAGVDEETIVEDYCHSENHIGPLSDNHPPHVPLYLVQSKPGTMLGTLAHINSKYGGAVAYLEHIGVTPEQLNAVKQKLLD